MIVAIIRGGAAYKADLFEGDVITAINGHQLDGDAIQQYQQLLMSPNTEGPEKLEIWRHGGILSKTMFMPAN